MPLVKIMALYKVKIGKQGRIVLPKQLRDTYGVKKGDEVVIIASGNELSIYLHKVSENPLQDLAELSEHVSLGLSATELKRKSTEERLKHFAGV